MGRYTTIASTQTPKGKRYKTTVKYPDLPLGFDDIYAYTDEGDRFDILAQQYYGNSNYWWVISIANETLKQSSLYLQPGLQIRIPSQLGAVLSEFNALNGN